MKYLFLLISLWLFACRSNVVCESYPDARDGLNMKSYDNGKPSGIYQVKNCLLNGIEIEFYENGNLKRFGHGEVGKKDGVWFFFDSLGIYLAKHFYKDGKFVFVSNSDGSIIMDSNYVLRTKNSIISLKDDSLINRAHYSSLFIKQIIPDSIYLESERKSILFDSRLKVLSEKENK